MLNFPIDPDGLALIIILFLLFALAIGIVISSIRSRKSYRESYRESYEQLNDEMEAEEPVAVGARVLSKRTDKEYVGSVKTPSYHPLFFVTFETDEGEIKEYSVSKEMFDEIYEDQTSTLLTVDGDFFYFGDGEDITI